MNNKENYKLLSEEEKNTLFLNNLGLINSIAEQFLIPSVQYEDIHSEALVGFAKALNAFNLTCNIKFTTYASGCMKQQILNFLRGDTKRTKLKSF